MPLPGISNAETLVKEMNARFAVVFVGSNVRILDEGASTAEDRGSEIRLLRESDFHLLMRNRIVPWSSDGEPQTASEFWLQHSRRRHFERIDFIPRDDAPADVYNLWRGFSVTPRKGNCERFWTFVRDVICDGNEEHYRFLRKWMAHMIQRPWELPGTAVVLRGLQGTGKNTFADILGRLVARHYGVVTSIERSGR
jgi:hypothetical protein